MSLPLRAHNRPCNLIFSKNKLKNSNFQLLIFTFQIWGINNAKCPIFAEFMLCPPFKFGVSTTDHSLKCPYSVVYTNSFIKKRQLGSANVSLPLRAHNRPCN